MDVILKISLNQNILFKPPTKTQSVLGYMLHSFEEGYLEKVNIKKALSPYILKKTIDLQKDKFIYSFKKKPFYFGNLILSYNRTVDINKFLKVVNKNIDFKFYGN